jgi:hypothetical protein
MYTENDKTRVRVLYEQGQSARKISEVTNIPRSTVSSWCQEWADLSGNEVSNEFLDDDVSNSDTNGYSEELDTIPDENGTISGLPVPFREQPVSVIPDDDEDEPKMMRSFLSPEVIELKKFELQLHHERELRKMDYEERKIALKEEELKRAKLKRAMVAENLSVRIRSIAFDLQADEEELNVSKAMAQEFLDNITDTLDDLIAFCTKNGLSYRTTEPYLFLIWIKEEIESWEDEFDDDDIVVSFRGRGRSRIEKANGIDIGIVFDL